MFGFFIYIWGGGGHVCVFLVWIFRCCFGGVLMCSFFLLLSLRFVLFFFVSCFLFLVRFFFRVCVLCFVFCFLFLFIYFLLVVVFLLCDRIC